MSGTKTSLIRGDSWTRTWILKDPNNNPLNLTGATVRLQVRDADDVIRISASTSDGKITLTPAQGRIDMAIPYTETNLAPGSYKFDLEVTHASGTRKTYEQGTLIVLPDVTR
jgi:hypothetical protein